MARAAQAERSGKHDVGGAARVAARRRPKGGAKEAPSAKKKGRAGGVSAGGASGLLRLFKLGLLVAACLSIGFFGILVLNVGGSVVGQFRLGETTVTELWAKVVDRVLDRDVPKAPIEAPRAAPAPLRPRPNRTAVAKASDRAPAVATRPEDDARHTARRPDPEIEHAKRRLDALLGRL